VSLVDNGGTDNGGQNTSAAQTFTITVTAVNDAPIARDDQLTLNEDTSVTADLRANDSPGPATATDEAGQTLTITHLNNQLATVGTPIATTHGTVTLNAGGTVTYAPVANYNGADSFTYTIR